MTQVPFRLTQRILRETTHQVTKKLGAAPMKSILSVTASQAMNLMIGTGLNENSKRSLCSPKTGIVFRSGLRRLRSLRRGRSNSLTVALTLALGIFASGCNKGQAAAAMPIPEVEVATVETRDVPMYGEWVATLDGYVNAEIRPQVAGYIIKQNYTEGSLVRKGQVLFEIDPRPFQAALDRAKGDLAQAQAQLGKRTLDVERDTPLAEARAIAKRK